MSGILREVLALVPESKRSDPAYRQARKAACDARRNVVHLIDGNKAFEGHARDAELSLLSLNDHWSSGLDDPRRTLAHPALLALPTADEPFVTHDVHRLNGAASVTPRRATEVEASALLASARFNR